MSGNGVTAMGEATECIANVSRVPILKKKIHPLRHYREYENQGGDKLDESTR